MGLQQKLDDDLKEAMRARDRLRSDTIRQVKTAVTNAEIQQNKPMTDAQIEEVIGRLVRQHRESIAMFSKGGRPELAQKEETELKLLQAYLPEQLTAEQVLELVRQAAKEVGARGLGDRGKVMGKVMPQVKGKADGKAVGDAVAQVLASLAG